MRTDFEPPPPFELQRIPIEVRTSITRMRKTEGEVPRVRGKGTGGCWAYAWPPYGDFAFQSGLIWPDEVEISAYREFPSSEGWYWYDFCFRLFRYHRNTTTGELSDRHVARLVASHRFEDNFTDNPEFYESFLGDVILPSDPDPFESWYVPSSDDVTNMIAYVAPKSCSGSDTGLMEVLLRIHFYVERKQTTYKPAPFSGWTYRGSTNLVVVQEVAWRYILP